MTMFPNFLRAAARVAALAALTTVSWTASANDYPTLETVDHVLTCMAKHGGQTVDNLYACSCEIDVIAQQVSFEDFNEARTYEIYKRMPGEKGGIFRDNPRAGEIVKTLDAARAEAEKRCFIGVKHKKAAAEKS